MQITQTMLEYLTIFFHKIIITILCTLCYIVKYRLLMISITNKVLRSNLTPGIDLNYYYS